MSLEYNEKDFTKKQRMALFEINAWGHRKNIIEKAYKKDRELAEKRGIPKDVISEVYKAGLAEKDVKFNKRAKRLKKK